jgi:ParB-like chromosome segregation protein Spo0J
MCLMLKYPSKPEFIILTESCQQLRERWKVTTQTYRVTEVKLDDIAIGPGRREINEGAVERLMDGIGKIGLRTPITLRRLEEEGEEILLLVAGAHRISAYRHLGLTAIPATIRDCTDRDAELWEISENAHRADLSVSEQDRLLVKWAKLLEDEMIENGTLLKTREGRKGTPLPVVEAMGEDPTNMQRARHSASVTPEAEAILDGAELKDNRSVRIKVGKERDPAKQEEKARQIVTERIRPDPAPMVAEPAQEAPASPVETKEEWLTRMNTALSRALPEWRDELLKPYLTKPSVSLRQGRPANINNGYSANPRRKRA